MIRWDRERIKTALGRVAFIAFLGLLVAIIVGSVIVTGMTVGVP